MCGLACGARARRDSSLSISRLKLTPSRRYERFTAASSSQRAAPHPLLTTLTHRFHRPCPRHSCYPPANQRAERRGRRRAASWLEASFMLPGGNVTHLRSTRTAEESFTRGFGHVSESGRGRKQAHLDFQDRLEMKVGLIIFVTSLTQQAAAAAAAAVCSCCSFCSFC